MIALALEFSSAHRSAAVLNLSGAGRLLSVVKESGERTLKPIPLIQRTLISANIERAAIECIVVGLGPGSYTGIRSAIALAQGWQLARGVQLLGISSVEALAWQIQKSGREGTVWVAIDAHRDEFYLACYRVTRSTRECLEPLRLASGSEVRAITMTSEPLIGPDLTRWLPQAIDLDPSPEALGFLSVGRTDFLPGEKLEPLYLRETNFVKAPPPRKI